MKREDSKAESLTGNYISISIRIKARPERKTDNLTAICEPII
jgi:putative lipoic acid-binding regulatory protein